MTEKNEIQDHILELRTNLMRDLPFYGEMLSHFDIVESSISQTAATEGRRIYYNPGFFEELSKGACNYVIMHELLHIILRHPYRAYGKNKIIWNVASDYVVNAMLDEIIKEYSRHQYEQSVVFEKPPCGCFMNNYYGESVEQLYHIIYERNKDKLGKTKRMILEVRGRYGDVRKEKIKDGDMDLLDSLDEDSQRSMDETVKEWTEAALRNWPNCPSVEMIRQSLFELGRDKVLMWKRLLKRFLREKETENVSYDHPERKYLHMDLILPGEGRETEDTLLEDVWAFIDTSGSISEEQNRKFLSQLYHICREFKAKVNIGYWDTVMREVYMDVSDTKVAESTSMFSGGTNAGAVYDFLEAEKIKASVILILTDGCFERISRGRVEPYRKKTIVVLSQEGKYHCAEMGTIARL